MATNEPRTVFIVGAGPGDPRLITVAGVEALQTADVVLHDRLVSPALLKLAEHAELINVGKTPGGPSMPQERIHSLMIEQSLGGRRVIRLKGGDPFVFGRGGEEASALAEAGIPMQIVPGVSSAFAAAASVGIAVTDRRAASAVTVVTGSEGDGDAPPIDWSAVAAVGGTIVLMMGWRGFDEIVERLTEAGLSPDTSAAAIEQAWTGSQRAVFAPLGTLRDQAADMEPPVTVVIGDVAGLASPEVSWTIVGRRILVTRAQAQMAPLVKRLRAFNAEVIELPTIEIEPVDPVPIDAALGRLAAGAFDIVCLTSVNGVRQLWDALRRNDLDARVFSETRIAAIGSETARELERHGIRPDLVPDTFSSAALAALLTEQDLRGRRILLARAAGGNPLLADRLSGAGAVVEELTLYRVTTPTADAGALRELERGVDVVTLTSPSTAVGLASLARGRVDLDSLHAVCIGPVTAEAAGRLGFQVVGTARRYTIAGLAEAVGRHLSSLPPAAEESADTQ